MLDDLGTLEALLSAYGARRDACARTAEAFAGMVQEVAMHAGLKPLVTFRAKTVESVADKFMRKHATGADEHIDLILARFTDLCGVRAIVHTVRDVDRLVAACRLRFDVDEANSVDRDIPLEATSFGYRSRHLILRVAESDTASSAPHPTCVELQIRTFAQHVWAEVYHDIGYKSEFNIPGNWTRDFARISAMLEECDRGIQAVFDEVQSIESHLDQYIDPEKLASLARRLEILHRAEPTNVRIVHRLVRVYNALGQHEKVTEMEADLAGRPDLRPALKRDLGFGLTRHARTSPRSPGFRRGQELIRAAIAEDPDDVDALSTLAGTYRRQGNRALARDYYRRAHARDPGFSYALANFLLEELLERDDFAIADHFSGGIAHARTRCLKQVEAGVNVPWVYFDLAFYEILQGATIPGLNHYVRGAAAASADWMIETTLAALCDLGGRQPGQTGLTCAIRTLKLIRAARFPEGPGLPSRSQESMPPPSLRTAPILILAGSGANMTPEAKEGAECVFRALGAFRGTIVSGGTTAGVPGIAGRLQKHHGGGSVFALGYLPAARAKDQDSRYSGHVHTPGTDYSALEPLAYWADLLSAGRDGGEVRLVGVGGGEISSFEYRLALAMGARVGLVAGSGREADKLLKDPQWAPFRMDQGSCQGRLLALDESTLAGFLA